jgi:hypothetical protein
VLPVPGGVGSEFVPFRLLEIAGGVGEGALLQDEVKDDPGAGEGDKDDDPDELEESLHIKS